METIPVTDGHLVAISRGAAGRLGEPLERLAVEPPRAVVSNTTVGPLYGRACAESLGVPWAELPDGEAHKVWAAVEGLCAGWLQEGIHRGHVVLAVGGGVVTDTVGFAAAVFLRGVAWMAVPTTLLAMVDAAVGGKTGVNLPLGKNLVGAFWPARLVVVDVATLGTLPERELRAGLVEVVKAGWISDQGLLDLVDRPLRGYADLAPERWEELVGRAIRVKAGVVAADPRELGPRRVLNLGHTLAHGLEAATSYGRFLHGEAVAWGLRAVILVARRRGLLSEAAGARLGGALDRLTPVPGIADIDPDRVLEHLARDKKRDDLGVGWVLPTDDGVVLDQRVPAAEVRDILEELRQMHFGEGRVGAWHRH